MKISKSKQELARIISENGGWRDGAEWSIQDSDKNIEFMTRRPEYMKSVGAWYAYASRIGSFKIDNLLPNWHQTILSRAEYFHLYPAPDADGWIEWLRDEPPVGEGVIIDVKYSDGDELHSAPCGVFTANMTSIRGECASAESFGRGDGSFVHIIAYRLHKPEQSKPEFCESVMQSIPGLGINSKNININITQVDDIDAVESKPTIEQLAADYRNASDYADRKQQEADDAKADVEAKLAELVAAGKALGLVLRVVGVEPELVITDWRDLQTGDLVWVEGEGGRVAEGEYEVLEVEAPGYEGKRTIRIKGGEGGQFWFNYENGWRFIRRP